MDYVRKDDPRLHRLVESRIDNRDEVREDHRRIMQAEIVPTIEELSRRQEGLDLEEEEDALEEWRRRIREKMLQRHQEEVVLVPEESEYETDSDEEMTGIAMLKPVFLLKSERETIAERERIEAEQKDLEEAVKKWMEERKVGRGRL
ncbi:microfibrillar-associated protein-related [Forsythia ovata]|uniref:Microfibrillar-associated protein-related n=1 Tax=Forsythia ovata TaxID=205694 RepID=A0ABD1X5R5_9LAMI